MNVPKPLVAAAIALVVVVLAAACVEGRFPPSAGLGTQSGDSGGVDETLIRQTVIEGLTLRAACDDIKPDRVAKMKADLARYWSDRRPSSEDLALRQAEWNVQYPTFAPPLMTKEAALMLTEIAADPEFPADKATANAESLMTPIDPSWRPEWSPRDKIQHDVDDCLMRSQSGEYPPTESRDEPLAIDSVDIASDSARVKAQWPRSWRYVSDPEWQSFTYHYEVDVIREDDGWRIADVTHDNPLP